MSERKTMQSQTPEEKEIEYLKSDIKVYTLYIKILEKKIEKFEKFKVEADLE